MKNYIQAGNVLTVPAPADAASGTPLLIGIMFGVATNSVKSGEALELKLEGVYDLPKATGAAWTVGQLLYWDDTAKNITGTFAGNTKIGVALLAAASGDTVGRVRLNGSF